MGSPEEGEEEQEGVELTVKGRRRIVSSHNPTDQSSGVSFLLELGGIRVICK